MTNITPVGKLGAEWSHQYGTRILQHKHDYREDPATGELEDYGREVQIGGGLHLESCQRCQLDASLAELVKQIEALRDEDVVRSLSTETPERGDLYAHEVKAYRKVLALLRGE